MWLFSRDGFFSVVKDSYCGDDELMVRARCREDLERFLDRAGLKDNEIVKVDHADYRYRTKVGREAWALYVATMAINIHYTNVKGIIAHIGGHGRRDAYMRVWEALYNWQERLG